MRHGAAGRRGRNRGNNRRGGGNGGGNARMQVFDSNGPDVRIRGTAYQIHEKYVALARDASGVGDVVLAESYLQHAEHYQRVINSWEESYAPPQGAQPYVEGWNNGNNQQQQQQPIQPPVVQRAHGATAPGGEDLGLPASILGPAVRQQTVESELADA